MIDLDGKIFSPVKNSDGGRVSSDAVFTFSQTGASFSAAYTGIGFTDGHLIGNFISDDQADLIYHSRANSGALEAGQARAKFSLGDLNKLEISMDWRWLNGSLKSGQSYYREI